jgi:hypothetical protein
MNAAERGLNLAAEDKALVETVWLLTQLPLAARAKDLKGFVGALRQAGLQVPQLGQQAMLLMLSSPGRAAPNDPTHVEVEVVVDFNLNCPPV